VFHFDRWWNPAVENQGTDRTFRIVNYATSRCISSSSGHAGGKDHEMIERQQECCGVVGTGEAWLTELSTAE